MGDFRVDLFTARERRAAVIGLLAFVVVAAAAVHELAPARAAHPGAPITPAAKPIPLTVFSYAAESASAATVTAGDDFASRRIYRTADAGRTWQAVKLPAGVDRTGSISVIPGTTDLLLWGGSSRVAGSAWRSRDHGAHWIEMATSGRNESGGPRFLDASHGYWMEGLLGGLHIHSTADGGRHWEDAFDLPASARDLGGVPIPASRRVLFAASTAAVGWLVVTAQVSDPSGFGSPTGVPKVFRSSDGWRTWQPASIALPAAEPDGYFLSVSPPQVGADGRGFIVMSTSHPTGRTAGGGFTAAFSSAAVVETTTDGGVSWSSPVPADRLDLVLAGGSAGLLLGLQLVGGSLLFSTDGTSLAVSRDLGTSWTVVTPRLPAGATLNQLSMLSPEVGWSLDGRPGEARGLLRTLDGGLTWAAVRGPSR